MKKQTIEIKLKMQGTNKEIKEGLRTMLIKSLSPVVVEMSFRTLDTFQGKWTEYAIVKAGGKIVKSPLKDFIRKSEKQKE